MGDGTCHFPPQEKHAGVICDEPDGRTCESEVYHIAGFNLRSEML
jgi:hypothetical protein